MLLNLEHVVCWRYTTTAQTLGEIFVNLRDYIVLHFCMAYLYCRDRQAVKDGLPFTTPYKDPALNKIQYWSLFLNLWF